MVRQAIRERNIIFIVPYTMEFLWFLGFLHEVPRVPVVPWVAEVSGP